MKFDEWENELITKGEAVEQCFNKWNKTNEEIAESIKALLPAQPSRIKGRYVDLSERILIQYYDEQLEEWDHDTVTIEDLLKLNNADYTVLQSIERSLWIKGKWIVTSEFEDCRYAKCSQCKATQVFYYNKLLTNFCPNCGAWMGGESEPEDGDL